jgi:DNA repair exonuclease SbcCD nuclease subunit
MPNLFLSNGFQTFTKDRGIFIMNFINISDTHLLWENPVGRLDNLPETQFDKFKFVLEQAKLYKASILHGGDFFDRPRSWSLLPVVIDLLKQYNIQIYGIFGQHDTYLYSTETRERTSLGILEKAGLITILNDQPTSILNVDLYGASFGSSLPHVGLSSPNRHRIGVVHESITDTTIYPGHELTNADKYLMDYPEYNFILCGDIHKRFEYSDNKRKIINTGPMIRKKASEYNFEHKPSIYLLDTNSPNKSMWIEIPHAPGNSVLSRDHIERKSEAESLLDEFVGAIKNQEVGSEVSFQENLHNFLKENKIRKEVVDVLSNIMQNRSKREEL